MTSTIEPGTGARTVSAPPCGALLRPAELSRNIDVAGLVDADGGLLDRAVFTDDEIYRQELRRIFAASWL
ncbi:MAG: aromatic ring-hydroxylating dioxygenase subunit alpha, partial [Mycobacterium sp.]